LSKCQLYTSYIWILGNAMSVVCNIFLILMMNSLSDFTFFDDFGVIHTLNLGSGGIFVLSIFKILIHGLFIKIGISALKTFKPIIKEIEHEEIHGINSGHQSECKAKLVKNHKRFTFKMLLGAFGITTLSILYAKSFFTKVALDFIDAEYDALEQNQTAGGNVTRATTGFSLARAFMKAPPPPIFGDEEEDFSGPFEGEGADGQPRRNLPPRPRPWGNESDQMQGQFPPHMPPPRPGQMPPPRPGQFPPPRPGQFPPPRPGEMPPPRGHPGKFFHD